MGKTECGDPAALLGAGGQFIVKDGQPTIRIATRSTSYNLKPSERANSDEFSKADLAATYAALNRTTAMPAEYEPPASTQSAEQRGKWAETLEARGGMAAVSRDITTVERGFSDDRSEMQRTLARARREEREKERHAERGHAQTQAGPAGPDDKPITPGGDPSVPAPPSRGGGQAGGQARTQTRGKDDEQPSR